MTETSKSRWWRNPDKGYVFWQVMLIAAITASCGFNGAHAALGATGALGLMDRVRNQPKQPYVEPTLEELDQVLTPAFGVYPKQRMRPRPQSSLAINGALMSSLDQQMQEFQNQPG